MSAVARVQVPATITPDDAALVAAMAAGDRHALALLYARHAPRLLAIGTRILGCTSDAQDLLHDVFLEAWRHASEFDPQRGRVRAWLTVRMRSRALDVRKSARVARSAGDAMLDVIAIDSHEALAAGATARGRALQSLLDKLSPDHRRALELAFLDGLTAVEIAAREGVPVGTAKSRIAAGLRNLRRMLRLDLDRDG